MEKQVWHYFSNTRDLKLDCSFAFLKNVNKVQSIAREGRSQGKKTQKLIKNDTKSVDVR